MIGDTAAGNGLAGAAPLHAADGMADLVVVPRRHPGRWVAVAVILAAAAAILRSIVANPNFDWPVVGRYLLSPIILEGFLTTLWLTLCAMAIGIALGIALAVLRLSENPIVATAARLYLWFFRGTPVLVQLIFWYNLAILYPRYALGLPFGPTLVEGSVNDLITPYTAALLGLGLNEGAYMAEIVRAGIQSVDDGQHEAAKALGMTRLRAMRRIILPQALRFIIPPTGNETIGMLKTTSLVSVISLADLLYSAQSIYSRTFQTIPLLLVACAWYLLATSVLTFAQTLLERRLAGRTPAAPSLWRQLRALRRTA